MSPDLNRMDYSILSMISTVVNKGRMTVYTEAELKKRFRMPGKESLFKLFEKQFCRIEKQNKTKS